VESGDDLPGAVRSCKGRPVLIDSLGTWLTTAPDFDVDVDELVGALRERAAPTVVVSEEAGLGVHPESEAGRRWRDALGEINQAVAAVADDVLLVVAGRVLRL
jgi:adenosyl cobinamide kinase/adenosyl cobinamide phosphate guanylyltransferase